MGKWEEGRLVSKWFIQLRVERAESRNFMVPVLQGSSPKRSSSPGQERQEASEGSTVQLGMTLERSLWEHAPLREQSMVLCVSSCKRLEMV